MTRSPPWAYEKSRSRVPASTLVRFGAEPGCLRHTEPSVFLRVNKGTAPLWETQTLGQRLSCC